MRPSAQEARSSRGRTLAIRGLLVAVALSCNTEVFADPFYVASNRFGYSGGVTRYQSLSDAQTQSGPQEAFLVPQRDLAMYITQGADPSQFATPDQFLFLTAWFLPDPPGNGGGNPNNTNTGLVQVYDADGSTIDSFQAYYTDSSMTAFRLQVTGSNATAGDPSSGGDLARFWQAPGTGGDALLTQGQFVSYSLDITFSGLDPATDVSGVFETSLSPSASISGTFNAIFQNTNPLDPSFNGFYNVALSLNTNSLALTNGWVSPTDGLFGSPTVVPEPSGVILLTLGGACLGVVGYRSRRRRSERPTQD